MNRNDIKRRPLADSVLAALAPEEKEYRELDGNNLYFRVQPSGKKSWQLRYKNKDGKWTWLGLGSYPASSAKVARLKAADILEKISRGEEIKTKTQIKVERGIESEKQFNNLMISWLDTRKTRWNEVTFSKAVKSINKHILPNFGHRDASEITLNEWFSFFLGLQRNMGIYNQVTKLLSYCRCTYDFGRFKGLLEVNPLEGIQSNLDKYEKGEMKHVKFYEVPLLLSKIREYPKREIAIGLELLLLLFPRPSELRLATWDQFDFNQRVWIRPASVMKNKIPHAIPLSNQAIALLKELKAISQVSKLLFPSRSSILEPISDNTFNMALKRLGYENRQDPHGFRVLISDFIHKAHIFYIANMRIFIYKTMIH
jgi:integrase